MIIKYNATMNKEQWDSLGSAVFKAHFWFGFDALAELFSDDYTAIVSDETISVYNTNKLNS